MEPVDGNVLSTAFAQKVSGGVVVAMTSDVLVPLDGRLVGLNGACIVIFL